MNKKRSEYMEWAKTCSAARFNLATSGIISVPRAEFPLRIDDLEITAPGAYGYEPLQERIARHAGVPADCVVAATGASMANHLAMAALLEPGDEVLIERPVYGPILDVAHYLGARVKRLERRSEADFALELSAVAQAVTPATRLIVLSNLHNPSGALIARDTLLEVAHLACEVGAHVIVDEVYLEMLFDQRPPSAFPSCGPADDNPFISTNSLTKAHGLSGLRCGWIIASSEIARRIWRLNDLFGANAAHPADRMSVMAFDHLETFRERTRALLDANRALLEAFLDSRRDLPCFRPPGGTVVFPQLPNGDPDAFFKLLREKHETSVVPGKFFEMPQHFRIGIGGETAELRQGLERLSTALDEIAA